jgi:RNA polymerase-binding transcription factor DksA
VDSERARARLTAERAAAAAGLSRLRDSFARLLEDSYANTDDEHDIEGASLPFERELTRATVRDAAARLEEIDAALARVDAGTYGRCTRCGEPIAPERLEARPSAATCVPCASPRRRRH